MLGLQTEIKLATLFKTVADGEKQIEVTRQVLAEQKDFEPYTAFKRIDRLSNGYLTVYDLHRFLRENETFVTEKDVKNIVKIYDSNSDDRLSYTDFLNLVLPNTSPALRKLATQRNSYYVSKYDPLPYEAEWALARVINKEIDYFRKVELLKEDLVSRYDFNLLDAFKTIDSDRFGYLSNDTFYYFLKRNNILVSDDDVYAIFRRIDVEGTGKINYSSFVDIVLPSDPYYRLSHKPTTSVVDYPKQRSASPVKRNTFSQSFYSPSKKLTNLDYYEYLNESAKRSPSRGRTMDKFTTSETKFYSPTRFNKTTKDDSLDIKDLTASMNKSAYQTPTKKSSVSALSSSRFSSPPRNSSSKKFAPSSPMKGNEEEHLASSLKEQIDNERSLESLKNDLSLRSDFNLLDAFRFFDLTGKGFITRSELEEGMREFNVFPSSAELYLIMRKYDTDNDSLLKYTEFSDMLTPKAQEYASILTKRVPTYAADDNLDLVFSWETKKTFAKLLNALVENEITAESLRQKLNRRPLFNVYEAFKALDKNDMGYFSLDEFKDLLMDHGIYASSKDLLNLVSRFDRNQDGKVSYSEFVQEMTPKSPSKIY